MTKPEIFPFVLPFLVMSIASILLCFYLLLKKKRQESDLSIQTQEQSVSSSGDQVDQDACFDQFPPPYSTVDHPPPYSLFDPKLTNAWPGGSRSPNEMFPITLPLAPQWTTPTEPPQPPSSPTNQNHQNPSRANRPTST